MLVNIKQLRNLPKAAPDAIIVFASGETNRWSNSATTSILLPAGTQTERPSTPRAGMLRFNTDINGIEFYDGTSWVQPATLTPTGVSAGTFSQVTVDSFGRVLSGKDHETRIASSSKNTVLEIFEDGTNNSAYATFVMNNHRFLKFENRNMTIDATLSSDNTISYNNLYLNFSPEHFGTLIVASAKNDYHQRVNGVSSIPVSWNLLLVSKGSAITGTDPKHKSVPMIGFMRPGSSQMGVIGGTESGLVVGNVYPFASYASSANRNIYFPIHISEGISVSSVGQPGLRLENPSTGRQFELHINPYTEMGMYERPNSSLTTNGLLTWKYLNGGNETEVVVSCRTTFLPGSVSIGTNGGNSNLQRIGIRTLPDYYDDNAHVHVRGNIRIDGDANHPNALGTRIATRYFKLGPNTEVSAFTVIGRAASGLVFLNVDGQDTPVSSITSQVYCFVFTQQFGPRTSLIHSVGSDEIHLSARQLISGSDRFAVKVKTVISAEATVTWMGGGSGRVGGVELE